MKTFLWPILIAVTTASFGAHANAVADPQGDFLPSFSGSRNAALDLLSADVTFDASNNQFLLQASTAGQISGANGAAYVFGFDTGGKANTPFTTIGEPGVAFNETVVLKADGTGTVGTTPVYAHVVGDQIFATVSAALLPSHGFADADYTWALWSIDLNISGLPRNADFAPDANVGVSAVPEPGNVALLAAGLGLLQFVSRRRSNGGTR
jgi:hypothetical protein